MSIDCRDNGPKSNSVRGGLKTRAEMPEVLLRSILEQVATPTIQLLSGIDRTFLKQSADFPVIERSLKLLLICHPYEARQDAAAAMLRQEPTALAQPVIEAAIPCGMQGEALRTSGTLLIERLGREGAADILVNFRDSNKHITDLLIETVRGAPEASPAKKQSNTKPRQSMSGRDLFPSSVEPYQVDLSDPSASLSLRSLTTNRSAYLSGSFSFSASQARAENELRPLDQLALKAFLQLVPFASQTLRPEKFDRRYLDTVWNTFYDDFPMRTFSATFAAFQTNEQTRDLVFGQLSSLDSALATSLRPLVSRGLADSPVHLSPNDYYDWYNSQL